MRHLLFFTWICLILPFAAHASGNLIPNPGFEDFKRCPKALGEIDKADHWTSPNGGSPDYFNACYTRDYSTVGIPNNFFGTQAVQEGQAYAGIYAGEKEIEYLQVQLLHPLEAGKRYCLRFLASPVSASGDQMAAIRVLGSETALAQADWGTIDDLGEAIQPELQAAEVTQWALMSSSFVARGGESYLIVGYFGATTGKGYTFLDAFELYEYDYPGGCGLPLFSGDAYNDQHNYVPNPGFELYSNCPQLREQFYELKFWRVMENTPDFYHRCGKNTAAVPDNGMGSQEPHQGDAYGGFWCYLPKQGDYREFISMELHRPLEKGEVYCLGMYVSLADASSFALHDLQMLPARSVDRIPSEVPADDPRLVFLNDGGKLLTDRQGWTRISALFVANGGERILTIGNFRKNDDPSIASLPTEMKPPEEIFRNSCYYYVDDVSLCRKDAPAAGCNDEMLVQIVADPDGMDAPVELTLLDSTPSPLADTLPETANWQAGDTLVLENFLFGFDASDLLPEALPLLDTLADYLGRNPELTIIVTGHTDDQGRAEYNEKLSRARAESVAAYLMQKSIPKSRIVAVGKGERVPLVANDSEEGRARNRRVEIEFKTNGQWPMPNGQ